MLSAGFGLTSGSICFRSVKTLTFPQIIHAFFKLDDNTASGVFSFKTLDTSGLHADRPAEGNKLLLLQMAPLLYKFHTT